MAAPRFLQRLARLPEVINLLSAYPEGLTLTDLSAQFAVDVETMREDLVTYLDLESWGWSHDIFRRPSLEFVHGVGEETVVRVVSDVGSGLGVEHFSAGDLATLYTAGAAQLELAPDQTLAEALGVIAQTMYGEPSAGPAEVTGHHRLLPLLREAQAQRRQVRVVYSRSWHPGVNERIIEPLRLVQTRRGWEVDAGPVGPEGGLRTFLLSNIRSADVLEATFVPPAAAESLLSRQRRTSTVRMQLGQDARWAARQYAEDVSTVAEDGHTFTADLELLPPVAQRVGLILLVGGPGSRILSPGSVLPGAIGVVEELLRHHEAHDPVTDIDPQQG